MILQSVYRLVDDNPHTALFQDKKLRQVLVGHKDWLEMGSPKEVSVTIMRPQVRIGSK